jgi:hypothetical protein
VSAIKQGFNWQLVLAMLYSFASKSHPLNHSLEQSQFVFIAMRQKSTNTTVFIATSKKQIEQLGA